MYTGAQDVFGSTASPCGPHVLPERTGTPVHTPPSNTTRCASPWRLPSSLSKRESMIQRAEELMELGSPARRSPVRELGTVSPHTKSTRPLPRIPQPLDEIARGANVETPPRWDMPTKHDDGKMWHPVHTETPRRRPLPVSPSHNADASSPRRRPLPAVHKQRLQHTVDVPSTPPPFYQGAPAAAKKALPGGVPPRTPSPHGVRSMPGPSSPSRSQVLRTPSPTHIPMLVRTPSPRPQVRTYTMTPAVPGGPPVPLLMVDDEIMTEAMMDPGAEDDATVSFDDSSPVPQHASSTPTSRSTDVFDNVEGLCGVDARCRACDRWIAGYTVHAMGDTWHAPCFVCAHCETPLEHVSFYEHQGRPYCHLDFHELFSRRCFHCKTPIVDERFVTIDDAHLGQRSYHELHFFCAGCGDPFLDPKDTPADAHDTSFASLEEGQIRHSGKPFFVQGAHPYCEACHTRLHRPKCKACRRPVEHDAVRALRADWHPTCFASVFLGPDGSPLDLDCYQAWQRHKA
ncbi:hypothetical protein MVES1_002821 [Malassezia vespertilionis]|nr:uncharacterized protein MVES1_002821 [Malassezia vespertilionis]WFD07456.1 hypothetical protein MVES1_002821 [Malassezia vespertilionis]